MPERSSESVLVRLLNLLGRSIWVYFAAVLVNAAVLGFSFNLVVAYIKKDVIDAASSGQAEILSRALILALATLLTGVPLLIASRYLIAIYEKKALTRARVAAFQQIVDLPIGHFESNHSGDLVSRCTNDLGTIAQFYSNQIPTVVFGLVLGSVGTAAIFSFSWQLGVYALITGGATVWASSAAASPLRQKSTAVQEALSQLTQRLNDILQGLRETKMFHLEDITHTTYARENARAAAAQQDLARIQARYDAINTGIEWMRDIGTLAFGLFLLSRGHAGLGAVVAAIHMQGNASFLFSNLGEFITRIQKSLAGSARVFEMLDWPGEELRAQEPAGSKLEAAGDPMVRIRDLEFSYHQSAGEGDGDQGTHLLAGISFTVPRGSFAALVGPSGSGKSTLIKILLGLYPVPPGAVQVNGQALERYPLAELRSLMAYVPQDAYLFDGTIEENIRYGKPGASEAEVFQAAEAAYADEFIRELPEGYATLVGERGARISGGQRQRIAIARALLKDAPILLLDEATSALDSESEALVQKALDRLMAGRTTIAIAHRLSTVQAADVIYVIQSGRIVESGSHPALLGQGGLYQELYRLQSSQSDQHHTSESSCDSTPPLLDP